MVSLDLDHFFQKVEESSHPLRALGQQPRGDLLTHDAHSASVMTNALLSLKKSCGLVLRLWHICIACACVAALALAVHFSLPKNVGQRSRLHTSALLSYVGLSSGHSTTQQQDLAFRVFPTNKTLVNGLLKTIYNNCLADEEQLLERTFGQRQTYRYFWLCPLPSTSCKHHPMTII